MATSLQKCPKCGGSMAQGFVIDMNGTRSISMWAAGAPVSSLWLGTKTPEAVIPIGTYRCSSCGYLESFARPEFAAK